MQTIFALPSLLRPSTLARNCLSKMSTIVVPIRPRFIDVVESERNSGTNHDGFKFRLVSYNILAQVYVKSSSFPHSPAPCLRWKARSQAILSALRSFGADFLCLQELDEYDDFYKENMKNQGYSGIYIQRSGKKRDGCGIFYKHNSAELLLDEKIEYNDLANLIQVTASSCGDKHDEELDGRSKDDRSNDGNSPEDRGDPTDPFVRLKRDCVGIMAAFKLKEPCHNVVIVANTHLYWDPEWVDVKLAQAEYLLSRLDQFRVLVSNKFGCTPSIILSGDFNSTPGDKVYQYLVSGSSLPVQPLNHSGLPIQLYSVYAFMGGEPPFTNCTPGFTGTLDYIFFSPSGFIKPVSYLELPEPDASDAVGGLPNYHHPSDHLPIGAEFIISKA